MRSTKIIALVIAMLGAVGSFIMIQNLANSRPSEAIIANTAPYMPEAIPQTPILLARQDIRMGKKIGPEDLEWVDWPEHLLTSPNFISKNANPKAIEEIVQGSIAKHGFVAGEPITKNKIVKMGDKSMMASLLTKGMVAISVAVNERTGVSGFISPGDRVDVMLTRPYRADFGKHIEEKAEQQLEELQKRSVVASEAIIPRNSTEVLVVPTTAANIKATVPPPAPPSTEVLPESSMMPNTPLKPVIAVGDGFYTETILRNVRVLAIDQTVDNSNSKEPAKVVNTVTFELPQAQAELLALAVRVGEINLSLRGLIENADGDGLIDSVSSATGVLGHNFEDQIKAGGGLDTSNTVKVMRDVYNSNVPIAVQKKSSVSGMTPSQPTTIQPINPTTVSPTTN